MTFNLNLWSRKSDSKAQTRDRQWGHAPAGAGGGGDGGFRFGAGPVRGGAGCAAGRRLVGLARAVGHRVIALYRTVLRLTERLLRHRQHFSVAGPDGLGAPYLPGTIALCGPGGVGQSAGVGPYPGSIITLASHTTKSWRTHARDGVGFFDSSGDQPLKPLDTAYSIPWYFRTFTLPETPANHLPREASVAEKSQSLRGFCRTGFL
jgi:hypothetical protein